MTTADSEQRILLRDGDMEVIGRMANSSNATLLVSITHGDLSTQGIYKPMKGERPLWDFEPGLYKREVCAYALSEALGWNLVPMTLAREGQYGVGSVQQWVEFDTDEHYFSLYENRPDLHARLKQMAVFDFIANNTDRKGGHVLIDFDDNVWGIDHGVCFSEEFKLRTVIWEFGGDPVDDELLEPVAALAERIPADVADWLTQNEVDAMYERIEWLLQERTFPVPESRYQYPWPLL